MKAKIYSLRNLALLLLFAGFLNMNVFALTPPPKPAREQIAKDLVGHTLKEGYEDGWFPSYWNWSIKSGQLKALKIKEILKETNTDYCLIVLVQLQSQTSAFNAKVKINYHLINNKWIIEYAVSQGMKIVKTNKYNDCLHIALEPHIVFGCNFDNEKDLVIKNNSEMALYCAGYCYRFGSWGKFIYSLGPHKTQKIEYAEDYKIEFIERVEMP